jgi:hypothetical protein
VSGNVEMPDGMRGIWDSRMRPTVPLTYPGSNQIAMQSASSSAPLFVVPHFVAAEMPNAVAEIIRHGFKSRRSIAGLRCMEEV